MPEAIAYVGAYLFMSEAATTIGAFLMTYAAEIATASMLIGGMAYSSMKSKQAAQDAKNAYNAAQVDRLVNVTSAIAPRELVMGRVRKGGAVFFKGSTGQFQKDLYLAIALAGNEIDAVESIYLNDVPVTLDGSGNVTTAPYASTTTKSGIVYTGAGTTATLPAGYVVGSASAAIQVPGGEGGIDNMAVAVTVTGLTATSVVDAMISYQYAQIDFHVKIVSHMGGSGQTADADLLAAFPADWLSANVVQGVAYLLAKFSYSETAFPSGAANVTAVIRGAKLLDPRTGTTVWSENPALMMRHVYLHPKFGKATITADEDAQFIAAANACDQSTVYTVGGVAQPACALFRAAIVLPFGTAAKSAFDDLSQAMGGSWAFAGGALYLKAGVYTASVMSLTDADLAVVQRSGASETQVPISISVHKARAQKFNTIKAKIWDQAQDYKQVDLTPLVGAALLTRDGVELVQEVNFPAIGYAPQALHVAGIMMRDARDPLTVDLPFKLRAYPLELFDTIDLTLSRYGWTSKTFMILSRTWSASGSLQLTVKETSAAITQMDSGFLPQGFSANTNLPKPWIVAAVGPLTVTSGTAESITQADGTVQSRMRISWPQVADAAVVQNGKIEIQYRRSDSIGEWASLVVGGDETQVVTSVVQDGIYYVVRARAKTTLAVGDWSLQVQIQVTGKTSAPTAPTATATGGMFSVRLAWTFGDTRSDILGTEIWWSATDDRSTAARLSQEPFPGHEYNHVGLSAGQGGYYWLRVVDTSGNPSAWYPSGATAGLYTVASADPSALLTQLKNSVGMSQLAAELAAPITMMPGSDNANAIASLQSTLSDWDITNRMQFQESATNSTMTIDPVTGRWQLLATANVTTDVENRLTAVEVTANADHGTLTSTVAAVATDHDNLTTAQGQITLLAGEVALSASQVYVDASVANATGALTVESANAASNLAQAAIQEALDAFTQGRALTGITATVATAQSDIKSTADALGAVVVSKDALVAVVAGQGAAILNEQSVRATGDSTNASSISSISARLDSGDFAAVQVSAAASASSITGLEAQYVVKVDANGHVAGIQLASGAGGASIAMLADKFLFLLPDGAGGFTAPKQAFILGTVNGVATLGLDGNLIVDGTAVIKTANIVDANITTLKIAGHAVTLPVSSMTAASVTCYGNTMIQSLSITTTGEPVFLSGLCTLETNSATFREYTIDIRRHGGSGISVTSYTQTSNTKIPMPVTCVDQPPAGTYTYELWVYGDTSYGSYATQRTLFAMELKR